MRLLSSFVLLGTLTLACGDPSPVIVGTVDNGQIQQALSLAKSGDSAKIARQATLELSVNGELRALPLGDDGSFAIQDLSTGTIELSIEVEGIKGTLTLEDVQAGEIVEIAISGGPGRLELRVVRRDPPAADDDVADLPNDGSPVRIKGHRVVYYLEPGSYSGDFEISGHDVTLIGGADCHDPTTLTGAVSIKAHRIRLVNVALEGPQSLDGHDVRIVSSCR